MKRIFRFSFYIFLMIVLTSGAKKSSFMIVLLPDTQNYTVGFPEIFLSQTSWISKNADKISFVLQQGDITNNNKESQWEIADSAFNLIYGKVPYALSPGNHDTGENGKTNNRNTDLFNQFFSLEKHKKTSSLQGYFEQGKMDNTWHTFRAGGLKWIVVSLEFGPRDSVLDWAGTVIKSHPEHKVIINTHAYMYSDNTRMGKDKGHKWLPEDYGIGKDSCTSAVNDGEQMWEKLVKKYPNIILVTSGHVLNDGTGYLVSKGINGNFVYQMLANYQTGVEGSVRGGDGFLRMLIIDPKNSSISVKTYSPYIDKYKTDPDNQFTINNVKF